jgi:tRNA-intron endonuclease
MSSKFEIYQIGNSFFSNRKEAQDLASKSSFGEIKAGKVLYSIYEALYLLENNKAELLKGKKKVSLAELLKKASDIAYSAFKDLRNKGYVVKEGLKFGADFRVYKPGEKPGKAHAKYLLYAVDSKQKLNLADFCAKARIAHSTNKALLLAVIDSEGDVSYYEVSWKSRD